MCILLLVPKEDSASEYTVGTPVLSFAALQSAESPDTWKLMEGGALPHAELAHPTEGTFIALDDFILL